MHSIIALLPLAARIPLVLASPPNPSPAVVPAQNHAPAITAAADLNDLGLRDITDTTTLYIAPDETCGFFGANENRWLTCNGAGYSCVYVATSGADRGLACCTDFYDCEPPTTCLDYEDATSSSLDDDGTFTNWQISRQQICTNSSIPYCKEITIPGVDATAWDCTERTPSAVTTLETTYVGQQRDFVTTVLSPSESSSTPLDSETEAPSLAPSGGIDVGEDTDGDDTDGEGSGGGDSDPPIGAIVGGTIGGVAVLAIAGLAIFFIMRKKKKDEKKDAAAAAAAAAGPGYMGPGGQPPMTQTAGYGGSPNGMQDNRASYMPYANQQGQYAPQAPYGEQQPQQLYPQSQYSQSQYPPQQGAYSPSQMHSTTTGSPPPVAAQHTGGDPSKNVYEADSSPAPAHEMDAGGPMMYK